MKRFRLPDKSYIRDVYNTVLNERLDGIYATYYQDTKRRLVVVLQKDVTTVQYKYIKRKNPEAEFIDE